MEIKSYKDLKVWQKAMDLAENVYRITASLPKSEQYGLVSQMRRAAISVSSNIAEGSVRRARGDFARFVNIASGSLAELETQFELCMRLAYIKEQPFLACHAKMNELSKMLFALYRSLTESRAA
jgi:four helix bundle protein